MKTPPGSPRARIRHVSRVVHHAFGWPGVVGTLLLGLALGTHLVAQAMRAQLAADQARADAQRASLAERERAHAAWLARLSHEDPVTALPTLAHAPERLAELHRLAALLELALPSGSYTLTRPFESGPLGIEITLPIKAPYQQIRPFVAMALNALPSLSLRVLSLRRATDSETLLDVQLRFVLYVREAGAP